MSIQKKRENCNHFVGSLTLMSLCALGLNGAFHVLTQTFPVYSPFSPRFILFIASSSVYLKSLCLICVYKCGHVCNAIVCTETCRVRCTDVTNCYSRVLFKNRWSISKTPLLWLCFWERLVSCRLLHNKWRVTFGMSRLCPSYHNKL